MNSKLHSEGSMLLIVYLLCRKASFEVADKNPKGTMPQVVCGSVGRDSVPVIGRLLDQIPSLNG